MTGDGDLCLREGLAYDRGMIQWGPVLVVVFSILVGLVYSTHHTDKRIDDLRSYLDARFEAVDKRFEDLIRLMEARFKGVEDRLDRLGHPVAP